MELFTISPDIVTKTFSDRAIILNLQSGEYYYCNPTAHSILELLKKNSSIDEIIENICTQYAVSKTTALDDFNEALALFRQFGFIK